MCPSIFKPVFFEFYGVLESSFDEFFVDNVSLVRVFELFWKVGVETVHIMNNFVGDGEFNNFFWDAEILENSVDSYFTSLFF